MSKSKTNSGNSMMNTINKNSNFLIEFDVLFEIILGLFLGMIIIVIFRRRKVKYHGPNSNWVRDNIFKYKERYYRYRPSVRLCFD